MIVVLVFGGALCLLPGPGALLPGSKATILCPMYV